MGEVVRIYRGAEFVGEATLEWTDQGIRGGPFREGPGYDAIKGIFQSFVDVGNDQSRAEQFWRERDALNLSVIDSDSRPVMMVVHINDFLAHLPDESLTIELFPK